MTTTPKDSLLVVVVEEEEENPSGVLANELDCGNLLSFFFFLLRCGPRPYEWDTQRDSNSLV